ncbi:hypothetical protein [Streptomyces bambusae]|uniref:Uncharacterized protein n=1 Tax=Streptomyces bambusae TaxID=1550616 RepID=A0ABS6ZBA0_9ACTN|nr:hypothetical protein [Streptomyces bambusae]MBW5483935.1 hypothetical protein [Streptomyces bambusae]
MHRTKASRILVPSALAAAILFGATAPASAESADRSAATEQQGSGRAAPEVSGRAVEKAVEQAVEEAVEESGARVAAGPIDDLVNGILEAIKALLPAGISLPPITVPEIKLPEITLPDIQIPGITLPQIPGVQLPQLPPLTPPQLPPVTPAGQVEIVPEIPDWPDIP